MNNQVTTTENETLDTRTIADIRKSKSVENKKLIGTQKSIKDTAEVVTIVNIFENAGKRGDLVRVKNYVGLMRVIEKDEIEFN